MLLGGLRVREPMAWAAQGQSSIASGKPGLLQGSSYGEVVGLSTVHVCVNSW